MVLTGSAMSGGKIAGGFTDYVKLMVENYCSNGIEIEVNLLEIGFL